MFQEVDVSVRISVKLCSAGHSVDWRVMNIVLYMKLLNSLTRTCITAVMTLV